MRTAAHYALKNMGSQAAFGILPLLDHKNPGVRQDVARTLLEIGNSDEQVLQALHTRLKKGEEDIFVWHQLGRAIKALEARRSRTRKPELPL